MKRETKAKLGTNMVSEGSYFPLKCLFYSLRYDKRLYLYLY